ncbi:MAG: glycosyltransferase family 2 protein, partial [Nitrospirota bacterium]|nr:glycosyltransferase family 2 protein [Nitrospirota bacterium]
MTEPVLSIIIVSFNTKVLLAQCLASIRRYPPPVSFETIVADNASADGSPEMVEADFPDVRLIRTGANLGFGAANNRGVHVSKGAVLLFLNSDTELLPEAVGPLLDRLDAKASVGIVGPTEQDAAGVPYPTICPAPDLWYLLLTHTGLRHRWYRNAWINPYRQYWEQAFATNQPLVVDWVSGASLMVRRAVLDQVGGFDEGYFMYMEETDLCTRARKSGWLIEYVPKGRLVHYGGGSGDKVKGGLLTLSSVVSEIRYFHKHRSAGELMLLKGLLFAEFLLKWFVARPRDPRR